MNGQVLLQVNNFMNRGDTRLLLKPLEWTSTAILFHKKDFKKQNIFQQALYLTIVAMIHL
jgi:hypothetical protein